QQAPPGLALYFAPQSRGKFGDETQLIGGPEGLHRSLRRVVSWARHIVHPHDHTIPLFRLRMPPAEYQRKATAWTLCGPHLGPSPRASSRSAGTRVAHKPLK